LHGFYVRIERVVRILFEKLIQAVVRPVAVVLVVRYQDWWEGFLGVRLGIVFVILILRIEQRLNTVGYEILRMENVIETSDCL
jgi:hypothetical protein